MNKKLAEIQQQCQNINKYENFLYIYRRNIKIPYYAYASNKNKIYIYYSQIIQVEEVEIFKTKNHK